MLVYLRKGSSQTNCMRCHSEIEVADLIFYLIQSQHTDTGPTSTITESITLGAWQGSHWGADFSVTGMTRPGKIPTEQAETELQICRFGGGRLNHEAKEAVRHCADGWRQHCTVPCTLPRL